jgi:hypothetical protein
MYNNRMLGVGFPRYAVGVGAFGMGRFATNNPSCPAFYSVLLESIIMPRKAESKEDFFIFFIL